MSTVQLLVVPLQKTKYLTRSLELSPSRNFSCTEIPAEVNKSKIIVMRPVFCCHEPAKMDSRHKISQKLEHHRSMRARQVEMMHVMPK